MGFPGGSAGKESACIVGGLGTNRVCSPPPSPPEVNVDSYTKFPLS